MTTTKVAPRVLGARETSQPGPGGSPVRRLAVGGPSLLADLGASVAVAAFSLAVAAGFARVFSGWEFMVDFAVVVAVGHGAGLVLRRLAVPSWIAVPAMAVVAVWTIAVLFYSSTLWWGVPTTETWDLFTAELTSVREQFSSAVAPVIYGGGWDVLAAIGLAIAVLLADVFAFRAFARAETLVPGGVLFVFVGAVGNDRLRITLTVVLIGVGVATVAALRTHHSLSGDRPSAVPPIRRIVPAAVVIALIVALTAGLVGPRLPGADAAPLYETRGRGGGVTQVVSPLVDIRSRLTNRTNDELFRVRADGESYWRASALPEFDGTTWRLPERPLTPVDEALGTPRPGAVELRQQIQIVDLEGSLVPAAADPYQASGPADLRWIAETSTLVTVDDPLELGDTIDVVSASPRFDAATLAAATSTDAGDPIYTDLPDGFPSIVRDTAVLVTNYTQNPYEAALALQDWFQTSFSYSLEVQSGHGNNAIVGFLRDRVGYCEQFAGTYAAMMRTLGIPARVAVGFTSGIQVTSGMFSVLGRHAHAWPEVWFDDLGWVAFEPTPGRGAPNAESYTRLPPQQDTTAADPEAPAGEAAPPVTIAPGGAVPQIEPNLPTEFADPTGADEPAEPLAAPDEAGAERWVLLGLVVLAALLAAPAVVRRVRDRSTRRSPEQQLAALWHQSTAVLRSLGIPVTPSQTPNETAAATAQHFPIVARPVALLADAVTTATYRAEGAEGFDEIGQFGQSTMRNCRNWARQIQLAVRDSAPYPERIRRYFTNWG